MEDPDPKKHGFAFTNKNGEVDRALEVISGPMPAPIDGVINPARYRLNAAGTALEAFPGFIEPQIRLNAALSAEKQEIDDCTTLEELKTVLKQKIDAKYVEVGKE